MRARATLGSPVNTAAVGGLGRTVHADAIGEVSRQRHRLGSIDRRATGLEAVEVERRDAEQADREHDEGDQHLDHRETDWSSTPLPDASHLHGSGLAPADVGTDGGEESLDLAHVPGDAGASRDRNEDAARRGELAAGGRIAALVAEHQAGRVRVEGEAVQQVGDLQRVDR